MNTKNDPSRFECYHKALPDEPVFTLLGRDPQAPGLVLLWATEREAGILEGRYPMSDIDKVLEARRWAHNTVHWRESNDGAWRQANPELPLVTHDGPLPCDFCKFGDPKDGGHPLGGCSGACAETRAKNGGLGAHSKFFAQSTEH